MQLLLSAYVVICRNGRWLRAFSSSVPSLGGMCLVNSPCSACREVSRQRSRLFSRHLLMSLYLLLACCPYCARRRAEYLCQQLFPVSLQGPCSQLQVRWHAFCSWIQFPVLAGRQLLTTCAQKEKNAKNKAADSKQFVKGNVAQILGIRGGDQETNIWKIRLQLTKPVTWIPLIWGKVF